MKKDRFTSNVLKVVFMLIIFVVAVALVMTFLKAPLRSKGDLEFVNNPEDIKSRVVNVIIAVSSTLTFTLIGFNYSAHVILELIEGISKFIDKLLKLLKKDDDDDKDEDEKG
jgi:uncharacterized membrane protein